MATCSRCQTGYRSGVQRTAAPPTPPSNPVNGAWNVLTKADNTHTDRPGGRGRSGCVGWGRARRRLARASRHPGIDLSPRQPKQPCVATVSNSQHSAHTCRCLEHLGSWLGFPPLPTPLTHPSLSLSHTPYSPRRCFGVESMLAILSIQYKQICWLAGGESHRGDGRKEREMGRLTACRVITPKKHAQAGGERGKWVRARGES